MDDITFNIDEDTFEEAEEVANARLQELYKWSVKNGVIFDGRKTKVLPHESEVEVHLRAPANSESYFLPIVTSYKYLGVWLAQTFELRRSESHCSRISKDARVGWSPMCAKS
jgi:hypothetical protein